MKLHNVLADAAKRLGGSAPHLGESTSAGDEAADGVQWLRSQLQTVSSSNLLYFRICVALLIVLFAGACLLVIYSLDRPDHVAAIFGATGVSFMGIFVQMARLWKDKVNSDLLIVLAGAMKPEDLRSIALVLLQKLK